MRSVVLRLLGTFSRLGNKHKHDLSDAPRRPEELERGVEISTSTLLSIDQSTPTYGNILRENRGDRVHDIQLVKHGSICHSIECDEALP